MRKIVYNICIVFLLVSSGVPLLHAQSVGAFSGVSSFDPSAPFFTFSGNTRVYGESANRQGSFSDKPRQFWRWEFDPTFAVFGLPFSVNVLYSSEEQLFRQNINAANIQLNPSVLQNYIVNKAMYYAEEFATSYTGDITAARDSLFLYRDSLAKYNPERLKELELTVKKYDLRSMSASEILSRKDLLEDLGLLSTTEKVMLWLPRVGFGTTYPTYTEFSLSGVAVNGVDVEWNPGSFFIQFTKGSVQNPIQEFRRPYNPFQNIDTTIVEPIVYQRSLMGGRLGYKSVNSGSFILSFVKSDDLVEQASTDSLSPRVAPQENFVLGMELTVPALDGQLLFSAEGSGSVVSSDVRGFELDSSSASDVPSFVNSIFVPRLTTYFDWAAKSQLQVNLQSTGTRFNAQIRRVGAGYKSLGVVNLRNDYIRYDVRLDQPLFNRQFTIGGYVRKDVDNLIQWKRSTTEISAFGVNAGLMLRNLPYLRVTYSPYYQQNNETNDTFKVDNKTSLLTVNSGYTYPLFGLNHSSSLTYSTNGITTFKNLSDFSLNSITYSQSVAFDFPLSLTLSLGQISQRSSIRDFSPTAPVLSSLEILNIDLSGTYTLFDVWNLNAGFNIADEQQQSTRTGYFLSTSVPIWNIANFDLRAERNVFSTNTIGAEQFLGNYNETVFRASISKRW